MVLPNPKNHPFFFLVIFSIGVTVVISGKVPIKKRSLITVEPADMKLSLSKRTFCNAFGCGGKRGELNISPKQDFYEYEQQGVIDLGDDSADDVARDILAEARLYEALEARNTLKMLQNRRQGFFPRQKRAASLENENELSDHQPGGVNPSLLTAKKSHMPR